MNVGYKFENSDKLLNLLKSMNKQIVKEKMEHYGIEEEPSEELPKDFADDRNITSFHKTSLKSFAVYNTENKKVFNCFKEKLRRKLDVKE